MATSRIDIDAPPERVYDVLADPTTYPEWLVGARRIRAADPRFPAPGTSFDHAVGGGPVEVKDSTTALAADRPHRLELKVRARPIGTGRVVFTIEERPGGCAIRFDETPIGGPAALLGPITDPIARLRNDRSLAALKRFVESRAAGAGTAPT